MKRWTITCAALLLLPPLLLVERAKGIDDPPTTGPATQPVRPSPEVLEAFRPFTVERDGKTLLRYRLLAPATLEPGATYPLVLFLHGSGERGVDNRSQLVHAAEEFLAQRERFPAFVLFPQCPPGTWWDGPNPRRAEPTPEGTMVPLPHVMQLMDDLCRRLPIDPSRLYVTGLSMGGFATFAAVAAHPERFAAAAPVCGGGDPAQAARLVGTPFWIFHGADDPVVPAELSRAMHDAIRAHAAHARYTEYPGVGHDAWTPTYANPALFQWMFAQRRQTP